jgi:O-antigen/teichoic acid export membrane protein
MNLNKNILKHTAIYGFASFSGKFVGFLMLPFYAHIFKTEGYGIIGVLDASLGLLSAILSPSIVSAVIRFYHEEPEKDKETVIITTLALMWGLIFFISPIILLSSHKISSFLIGSPKFHLFVSFTFISLALDVSGQTAGSFLIINQRSLKLGLTGYFVSAIITAFITSSIFHIIAIKNCGVRFDRTIAIKIIRFQLPLIPSQLIGYLARQAERVLVRFMVNLQAVGVLEMGYKFPPLLGLLITQPFFRTWHTKRTEIAEKPGAPEEIGRMFTNYLFVIIFLGLMLSVNIKNIIEILTPPEFWPAYKIARIEIITVILVGSCQHMIFGLYYEKMTKKISFIISTTSVVKIIISLILIKYWGIMGAAYSACVIGAVRLGWYYKESQKLYFLPIEYKKILVLTLSALSIHFVLNQIQYDQFFIGIYAKNHILIPFSSFLAESHLGTWKSGKLIHLFLSKQIQIIACVINSIFCLSFLFLLPFIRPSFGRKVLEFCRLRYSIRSERPNPRQTHR